MFKVAKIENAPTTAYGVCKAALRCCHLFGRAHSSRGAAPTPCSSSRTQSTMAKDKKKAKKRKAEAAAAPGADANDEFAAPPHRHLPEESVDDIFAALKKRNDHQKPRSRRSAEGFREARRRRRQCQRTDGRTPRTAFCPFDCARVFLLAIDGREWSGPAADAAPTAADGERHPRGATWRSSPGWPVAPTTTVFLPVPPLVGASSFSISAWTSRTACPDGLDRGPLRCVDEQRLWNLLSAAAIDNFQSRLPWHPAMAGRETNGCCSGSA